MSEARDKVRGTRKGGNRDGTGHSGTRGRTSKGRGDDMTVVKGKHSDKGPVFLVAPPTRYSSLKGCRLMSLRFSSIFLQS